MKKIATILTSVLLCVTMLALLPAQVVASAADNVKKYISEVKVGMGETAEAAAKELLAEGFTILTNDKGEYADLNKDAGSKSILKEGPNQKIVYIGYKTTENAGEAVTDLAVMNMDGGYSYQEYEKLLNDHMDGKIKPFLERFVSTLEEYRANLKKPQDSVNYKRADYYRTLLNKLTDDDTGAKPLGDLLVNQTKYEMGDAAYNKLSDAEKKNHCDITTLLLQGNGQAVMLMETQLAKASDSGSNTWLDRFTAKNLDALTDEIREENPDMTPSEINAELDKLYNDDARRILDKWSAFSDVLSGYDDALDKADEVIEAGENEKEIKLDENSSDKEASEALVNGLQVESDMVKGGMAAEDIVIHDYLEATKYGSGTLLDFFERDASDFSDEEGIRELYPIADALSGGQLAGLDFLSIKDMFLMAITDEAGYQSVDLKGMKPASIYQDVNREIYEKGGVALTSDAMREDAVSKEKTDTFKLSTAGYVFWGSTAVSGLAIGGSQIAKQILKPDAIRRMEELTNNIKNARLEIEKLNLEFASTRHDDFDRVIHKEQVDTQVGKIEENKYFINQLENDDSFKDATKQFALKSKVCNFLSAGFALITAVLAGISIYTTITEMKAYYKVNFAPIPKYMVEKTDITVAVKADGTIATEEEEKNGEAQRVFEKNETAYYKVVPCNRTDGGGTNVEKKNHEVLLDRSDLNGDVGKQWLALYSVKYANGMPILADSLKVVTGSNVLPDGYSTGIHFFGSQAAFNLTSEKYCYNDTPKGTFVYFKNEAAAGGTAPTAAGSAFSGGFIALGTILGAAAGAGLTLIIVSVVNKKKKNKAVN